MGRRSPQSALKRAREQALRERRERKEAKKDARAAKRRAGSDEQFGSAGEPASAGEGEE